MAKELEPFQRQAIADFNRCLQMLNESGIMNPPYPLFLPRLLLVHKKCGVGVGVCDKTNGAQTVSMGKRPGEQQKMSATSSSGVALIFFMENAAARPSHLRIHRDLYAILRHLT